MKATSVFTFIALTGLAAAIVLASPTDTQSKSDQPTKATLGKPAPDFTLLDHTGKKHQLSDYKDKLVVLEWVNQQCPWSVKAIPAIKELRKKFADQDVVWLGVESTHWRTADENIKYVKQHKLAFPILMDNDGRVGRLYEAATTPHMFVINQGTLVYDGALHNNQRGRLEKKDVRNYVEEALTAVLAGKPVPLAETKPWGCSVKYKKSQKDK